MITTPSVFLFVPVSQYHTLKQVELISVKVVIKRRSDEFQVLIKLPVHSSETNSINQAVVEQLLSFLIAP